MMASTTPVRFPLFEFATVRTPSKCTPQPGMLMLSWHGVGETVGVPEGCAVGLLEGGTAGDSDGENDGFPVVGVDVGAFDRPHDGVSPLASGALWPQVRGQWVLSSLSHISAIFLDARIS